MSGLFSAGLRAYKKRVQRQIETELQDWGEAVEDEMRANLERNGSIDTGALYDSVRSEIDSHGTVTDLYIYADATSEQGVQYKDFLEFGTGIHNETGKGRKTPWRYQDRYGQWHTTRGMTPRPFIRPALATCRPLLREKLRKILKVDQHRDYGGV